MNYVTVVCPHCGTEFVAERGGKYLCPLCDRFAEGDITSYDISVDTGRALFSAYVALRDGDKKSALKLYKTAVKTDKKNPTPLLLILFCKHGVKYERGKLISSDGKPLLRDGLFKKMLKLGDRERGERYAALITKIDNATLNRSGKPLKPNNIADFRINDGELRYYKGNDEDVVIPPSVKKINGFAFLAAKNTKSVYVSSSVEEIDARAFTADPPIRSITIALECKRYVLDGGCVIDTDRSAVIRGFHDAVIPEYVTAIDDYAFEKCTELTEIVIPNSVTYVGECAFGACEKLKRVVIPASLTEICDGAFSFCHAVDEFDVDEKNAVFCVRSGALYNKIENKVIRCGADGKVPDGAVILGESSFDGGEFTELHIPASVTKICDYAVDGCGNLQKLTVDDDNSVYASVNNCLINKVEQKLIMAMDGHSIPDDGSVRIIGENVFRYSKLKSVKIPSSVRVIEDCAYADGEFEQAEFSAGLEKICDLAFTNCCNITCLQLPRTLRSIGEEAFGSCEKLKSVNVPASVEIIEKDAFLFCDELENANFENTDGWVYGDPDSDDEVEGEMLSDAWIAADILKSGKKLVKKVKR